MKKIIILLYLLTLKFSVFAQSFQIVAGLNESTFIQTPVDDENTNKAITGFHIGAFFELHMGNLSIQPGLLYASIGGDGTFIDAHSGIAGTFKNSVQYLQMPVNFLYNIPVNTGMIFLGGGPYIGIGLAGTATEDGTEGTFGGQPPTIHYSYKYTFSKSDTPDYGLNVLAGTRFKNGLLFSLGYGYGLKYLFYKSTFERNGGVKNNVASISVGYAF
ncbi:MAG: outer membrane beta-barrel protein [Mucilaginibacter sp.]